MIHLESINAQKLMQQPILSYFPLCRCYLSEPLFSQPQYEWFMATDDQFEADLKFLPYGIVCVTENKFLPSDNMHISCIEISTEVRSMGLGSALMNYLIATALDNDYKYVTLQIREPHLETYYNRFGFTMQNISDIPMMVLEL